MSLVTKSLNKFRTYQAAAMIADLAGINGDRIYFALGHAYPWSSNDTVIPQIVDSTKNTNQVFRDLVAMKNITIASSYLVVPRVDWSNGTSYYAYNDQLELYTYEIATNANGTVTFSNTTVIGTNTTFLLDFANNEYIQVAGDGITVFPQRFEIISIQSNTQLTINNSPSTNIIANVPQEISNTYPNYAYNFYVRNSYDQVFICLGNNNGIVSNTMPTISLGGQLPNSQFIITGDGYLWKYLYTIPSGLKQNFFTQQWMPVIVENQVANSAMNGRLDVIQILNGGSGYNNTAASLSAAILTVVGDGKDANLTAVVSNSGVITGINILNAGQNYTKANVIVASGSSGSNANIHVIISPPGGWGSNVYTDLGVRTVMCSISLANTENGTIPETDSLGENFKYRQIVLLRNPTFANGAGIANGTNYDLTTSIAVSTNVPIAMNDLVYQSPSGAFANATYSANCVWFDSTVNVLHINNSNGIFTPQTTLYATKNTNSSPYISVQSFSETLPVITAFSGQLIYLENHSAIQRAANQTENLKLLLTF